jgi:hypothetical protein
MSIFWDLLKIRASLKIQDAIIDAVDAQKRSEERAEIEKNAEKIIDAVYNNEFTKIRNENKPDSDKQ